MNKDIFKRNLSILDDVFDGFKDDMASKGYEQYFIVFDYLQEQLLDTLNDYYYLFCLKESENNE